MPKLPQSQLIIQILNVKWWHFDHHNLIEWRLERVPLGVARKQESPALVEVRVRQPGCESQGCLSLPYRRAPAPGRFPSLQLAQISESEPRINHP